MIKTMKLSSLQVNEIGQLGTKKFIVINRYPADRSSGMTSILYFNKERHDFYWDHENPEVAFVGRGRVDTEIIEEK